MTLQRPYLPDGFHKFWEDTVREADLADLDFSRSSQSEVSREGFEIELVDFKGVSGDVLHGWFAFPTDAMLTPAFVWLAPYGRRSMPPDEYGTRPGFCSLSFNHFGESAFHHEEYEPDRGYFAEGIGSSETWVFRRMFQDSVIAARVLAEMEETNAQRIGAMGMSQGGGIAVWMGAFCRQVKAVCADLPFGAARPMVFSREIRRYPLKEVSDYMAESDESRDRAMRTMAFFDTVNLASLCEVPTVVTVGLKDPFVKSSEVLSVFEALAGEKRLDEIDGGHDWHPSMVDRNREWLAEHL